MNQLRKLNEFVECTLMLMNQVSSNVITGILEVRRMCPRQPALNQPLMQGGLGEGCLVFMSTPHRQFATQSKRNSAFN